MSPALPERIRPLYDWEIGEARKVFGDQLRYDLVRIHENASWPDFADRIGRWIKRMPPLGDEEHNAITLGYHSYFPAQMPENPPPPGSPPNAYTCWMMHELTHAWQYQHIGWRYLVQAVSVQMRLKAAAYDYGGPENLTAKRAQGWTIANFNPEQQGNISEGYYTAQGFSMPDPAALAAYLPYIQDIMKGG